VLKGGNQRLFDINDKGFSVARVERLISSPPDRDRRTTHRSTRTRRTAAGSSAILAPRKLQYGRNSEDTIHSYHGKSWRRRPDRAPSQPPGRSYPPRAYGWLDFAHRGP
jgi:hypothetical protein